MIFGLVAIFTEISWEIWWSSTGDPLFSFGNNWTESTEVVEMVDKR
jgi:hypothetical protein